MAIKVELAQEEVKVEPGGSAQVFAVVRNMGTSADQVALEVEGLDTEWCAIPVPSVQLEPGSESKERILIRPPRSSESRAGVYPFVVRARSLENGGSGVAQASLIIQPFNLLTLEINPKRDATSYFRKEAYYDITISNLGNSELNLQLFASEPEEGCAFEFESERVKLLPGESQTVWLKVQPTQVPLLGSARLYGFTASARAVENPYIAATVQGQLERRSLITPTTIWVMMLLLLLGTAAWWFWPRQVTVLEFTAKPDKITAGQETTLAWQVLNAQRVIIEPGIGEVDRQKFRYGEVKVSPLTRTIYRIVAEDRFGRKQERFVAVDVSALPPPAIESFTAEPRQVNRGEPVILRFRVKNADKVFLSPPGQELNPALPGYEHTPVRSTEYVLIAENATGQRVEKKVRVEVVEPSLAQIVLFTAEPTDIKEGESVKLRWEIKTATKAQINQGIGEVDPISGETEVSPRDTTTYTLTATDINGRPVKQSVTVRVLTEPKLSSPPIVPGDGTNP